MGDLLDGPAAVLLAGERPGDHPAGVGSSTSQTAAVPATRLRPAEPLLGLRAEQPAQLQPARLPPKVHTQSFLLLPEGVFFSHPTFLVWILHEVISQFQNS